jgi:hypothetical protein
MSGAMQAMMQKVIGKDISATIQTTIEHIESIDKRLAAIEESIADLKLLLEEDQDE